MAPQQFGTSVVPIAMGILPSRPIAASAAPVAVPDSGAVDSPSPSTCCLISICTSLLTRHLRVLACFPVAVDDLLQPRNKSHGKV
ncbi:hypothetical protein E2562_035642 [Oryza meyeriana var. granulata]|uniref:Uncharacterized protein n=1 Tax=Oryza meyeriana var. granulata TaxID=110450 RepID=A0A6G1E9B1_9ORYZ|nr:hypothetical protein E2562_035642 [Oryza meyeriana var. granulata]